MTPCTVRPKCQRGLLLIPFCLAACISTNSVPNGDDVLAEEVADPQHPGDGARVPIESDSDEATQAVRIRFRARVEDELFACGSTYTSDGGVTVTPRDLRFFVQDLALLTSSGEEEPVLLDVLPPWQLADVALLDFEDGSGSCSGGTAAVNIEVVGHVRPGSYRGLVFTNGVPDTLNHADPATLPPPLQAGSMSWGWLLGYRFLMAELMATDAVDGSLPGSALLHVGSTGCSGSPAQGTIHCQRPNRNRVALPAFELDSDVVVVDVAELFAGLDLSHVTTCHSSDESCADLLERMGVPRGDGSTPVEQRLYRVEAL